jgi:DsbC/DsbD-like thiol-disulfide interchange protein
MLWAAGGDALAAGPDPAATASLMPGWRVAPERHVAALRIELAPGWRTYWRVAGSGGISPVLTWTRAGGVRGAWPVWPSPTVWREGDALSLGFEGVLLLPIEVSVRPGPARLEGRAQVAVCAEVCIPMAFDLSVALPDGGMPDPAILRALRAAPDRIAAVARCGQALHRGATSISASVAMPSLGGAEVVVLEPPDRTVWVADAQVVREGGRLRAWAEAMAPDGGPARLDLARMRITVLGERGAVELAGCAGGSDTR